MTIGYGNVTYLSLIHIRFKRFHSFTNDSYSWAGLINGNEKLTEKAKIPFAIGSPAGSSTLCLVNLTDHGKSIEKDQGSKCSFQLNKKSESCVHLVSGQEENVVISTVNSVIMCSLSNFKPIWKVEGEVDGLVIDPHGITSRNVDCIYVADGKNKRVLEFSGHGRFRTVISKDMCDLGFVYGVKWVEKDSSLLVLNAEEGCNMFVTKSQVIM